MTELGSSIVQGTPQDLGAVAQAAQARRDARLMEAAQALEASFVSEMFKAAGVDGAPSAFGGGIGEEQFSSFLRDAQARDIVRAGGIGLAQSLFEAMQARQDA